jgi:hypothetical protein
METIQVRLCLPAETRILVVKEDRQVIHWTFSKTPFALLLSNPATTCSRGCNRRLGNLA